MSDAKKTETSGEVKKEMLGTPDRCEHDVYQTDCYHCYPQATLPEVFDTESCEKAFDELYERPRDEHIRAKLMWTFGDGARWMFEQLSKKPGG